MNEEQRKEFARKCLVKWCGGDSIQRIDHGAYLDSTFSCVDELIEFVAFCFQEQARNPTMVP